MAVNKVTYAGRTLVDLTSATATANAILKGYTAYGKSGAKLTGTATTLKHTALAASLPKSGWSGGKQVILVSGVTADAIVIVEAAASSEGMYRACGVACSAQGAGKLTFTCGCAPTADLTVSLNIIA